MIDASAARSDMRAEGCSPVAVAPFAGFGPIVRALCAPLAPSTRAEAQIEARRGYAREALELSREARQREYARTVATREAHDRAVLGGVYRGD